MEIEIKAEEFFKLVKVRKPGCCAVTHCRRKVAERSTLCHKHKKAIWRARNPMRDAFKQIADRAKHRGTPFEITWEEWVELCAFTGYLEGKGTSPLDLALDRIDSEEGYRIGNVRVITFSANARKGAYERKAWLKDGRFVEMREVGLQDIERMEAEAEARRRSHVPYFFGREVNVDEAFADEELPPWLRDQPADDDADPF